VYRNADLHALVTQPDFVRDSIMLNASAQLPSMSVPNWVALITVRAPRCVRGAARPHPRTDRARRQS
jgi:hypothetical protein